METVTSGEYQRNIGFYQDKALISPLAVTRNGRERLIIMSAEEYHRLKRRDRQVMTLADFTEEDIKALRKAQAVVEASAFNGEGEP